MSVPTPDVFIVIVLTVLPISLGPLVIQKFMIDLRRAFKPDEMDTFLSTLEFRGSDIGSTGAYDSVQTGLDIHG